MSTDNLIGQSLGRNELRRVLGRGGMGAVYEAFQPNLKRKVAVKVIRKEHTDDARFARRFKREAEIAARLRHPNIVEVYDYGTVEELGYVVMPFLEGGSLFDRLERSEDIDLEATTNILTVLADALDYAHKRGVIHRDLKLGNIMFDERKRPIIVDFGISKLLGATTLSGRGDMVGTPEYMPPEQWNNEAVTGATDQYAMGVVVYRLLTGKLPFTGETAPKIMYAHLEDVPTPPYEFEPKLPLAASDAVMRALSKDAGDRFPTMRAFAAAFSRGVADGNMPLDNKEADKTVRLDTAQSGQTGQIRQATKDHLLGVIRTPLFQQPMFWVVVAVLALTIVAAMLWGSGENTLGTSVRLREVETQEPTDTPADTSVNSDGLMPNETEVAVLSSPVLAVTSVTATASPTASNTPSPTASQTPTSTASDTATSVPSSTSTLLPSDTVTSVPSSTPTLPPSDTATLVPSSTPTPRPSDTATIAPTATETPTPPPPPTQLPPPPTSIPGGTIITTPRIVTTTGERIRIEMVVLPVDCVVIGEVEQCFDVQLAIDTNVVTQGEYDDCVEITHCARPSRNYNPGGTSHLPVTNVSWYMAQTYCQWRQGRIPTEPELIFADGYISLDSDLGEWTATLSDSNLEPDNADDEREVTDGLDASDESDMVVHGHNDSDTEGSGFVVKDGYDDVGFRCISVLADIIEQ